MTEVKVKIELLRQVESVLSKSVGVFPGNHLNDLLTILESVRKVLSNEPSKT